MSCRLALGFLKRGLIVLCIDVNDVVSRKVHVLKLYAVAVS